MGILVPGIEYDTDKSPVEIVKPTTIYRLKSPMMKGAKVSEIQRALSKKGIDTGKIDGVFGKNT